MIDKIKENLDFINKEIRNHVELALSITDVQKSDFLKTLDELIAQKSELEKNISGCPAKDLMSYYGLKNGKEYILIDDIKGRKKATLVDLYTRKYDTSKFQTRYKSAFYYITYLIFKNTDGTVERRTIKDLEMKNILEIK